MSLLEDVFLEDEAGEAQELERVIEGDEYDERPGTPNSNENSEQEDEAEEDKRRVDHTAKAKRVVKNPRFVLNPARLTGPRGIQVIPDHFKDFKFKGKGHEREDLDVVLKKLEHWAYRLYPKFKFEDCLKKIETLGKKRPVMVHLHKIRTDQFMSEETVVQKDSSDDEAPVVQEEDEFDRLLQQQIELARSTPAPGSARKEGTPSQYRSPHNIMLPKATSSPSINDEQKERMMRNRKLAEERRLARLNQIANLTESVISDTIKEKGSELIEDNENNDKSKNMETENDSKSNENDEIVAVRKNNRSNVIDSSDDDEGMAVNESITADVHTSFSNKHNDDNDETEVDENTEMIINKFNDPKIVQNDQDDAINIENNTVASDNINEEGSKEYDKDEVSQNDSNNENQGKNKDQGKDGEKEQTEEIMDVDFSEEF